MLYVLQLSVCCVTAQSLLRISGSAGKKDEILTLERLNPALEVNAVDTFIAVNGMYELQVKNVSLPMVAVIRSGQQKLRLVFLAPGFPLTLQVVHNKVPEADKTVGPWSALDSLYKELTGSPDSSLTSIDNVSISREEAYKRQLLRIDSSIPPQYRPLKDFLMYAAINQAVDSSNEILQLSTYQLIHQVYLNQLAYGTFRTRIERKFDAKVTMLAAQQRGKPAPAFVLKDSTGNLHRLTDYKGKVVYLDLWASWCMPCRLQTPYMHRLMKRYSQRKDVVIIGVAIGDRLPDWKRALRQDKPAWLQLYDNNTSVTNAFAARSIPRYILIDKEGNVLDFYAPSPSDPVKLIAIIDKALGI